MAPDPPLRWTPFPTESRARLLVHIEIPEFTCLCPLTGSRTSPAGARLRSGCAQRRVEEPQLYAWSYRDRGAFHEAVTNRIVDDLVRALKRASFA